MELEKMIIILMIFGIAVICVLEVFALSQGINGTAFGLSMAGIAAIVTKAVDMLRAKYKAKVQKFEIAQNNTTNDHLRNWSK